MLGNISKTLEQPPMLANHTFLEVDLAQLATTTAPMERPSDHTNVLLDLSLKPLHLPKSNLKSLTMDPWKLPSQFIKTSSNTRVVFTNTPPVEWLVDTPSRFLVGVKKTESTTGSV